MSKGFEQFSKYYKRFENTAGVFTGDPVSSIDSVFAKSLNQNSNPPRKVE